MTSPLPTPDGDVSEWVRAHLDDVSTGDIRSAGIRGGRTAALEALGAFDVTGYARRRNEVWPLDRRGASRLSPYIRHGLITLREVWTAVSAGPEDDVSRFRDELLWQEYARHVYARLGQATRRSLRFSVLEHSTTRPDPWETDAACIDLARRELTDTGWLPNQTRMWLASHWSVRNELGWRDGEDVFFRYLLDGSRAANRIGWQWTSGALTGKPYGFSRWQVTKRAPGLCDTCRFVDDCPIEDWPDEIEPEPRVVIDPRVRKDPDADGTGGPRRVEVIGNAPDAVWITAESLGDCDPALAAHPELPAVFVFDESLLRALRLAGHRLVFLAEALADLATRRPVQVWRGNPRDVIRNRSVAVTFTPVPGWRQIARATELAEVHPWPWLVWPHRGSVTSFTAWRRSGSGPILAG